MGDAIFKTALILNMVLFGSLAVVTGLSDWRPKGNVAEFAAFWSVMQISFLMYTNSR